MTPLPAEAAPIIVGDAPCPVLVRPSHRYLRMSQEIIDWLLKGDVAIQYQTRREMDKFTNTQLDLRVLKHYGDTSGS
jgi:hypothetical protein